MISQNRAEAKRQVLADQQWRTVEDEDSQNKELLKLSNQQEHQNKELLTLSKQILTLTRDVRSIAVTARDNTDLNKELLEVSTRTLALAQKGQADAGSGSSPIPSG